MGKALGVVVIIAVAFIGYSLFQKSKVANTEPDTKDLTMKATGPVKEFTTTAYYDETGVWYSLKEIRVKKGDTVRVMATNTKGMHDFVIDEFGVKKELPMNEAVTIEFTANKTGEFIYYCSKPGHRDKGQWGKLIVE